MTKRIILQHVSFLLIFLAIEAVAYSDVRFEHLSLEHGLAQSSVQDLVHDELGYLWIATQFGLSRFDGYGFRNFRHDPEDPSTLSNSRIQHLHRARNGTLWIGTRSGVNRLDPRTLAIERIEVAEWPVGSGASNQPQIHSIAEDASGHIVLQAIRGVLVHHKASGRLRALAFDQPVDSDVRGTMQADRRGRIWLFNADGLWRVDPEGLRLRHVLDHPLEANRVRHDAMTMLPTGELALAGENGVLLFDPEEEAVVRRIRPTEYGADEDWVGALAADARGDLWMLARNALVQYDPADDHWQRRLVRREVRQPGDWLAAKINVVQDQRGYAWIGLPEGVGLSSADGERFRLLQHDPNRPASLSASPRSGVYTVHVDDFGVVWVGGGLGGLSRFTPQSTRFEHVMARRQTDQYGADNIVRAVFEYTRDGRQYLWSGLSASGIRVWERTDGAYDSIAAEFHMLAPAARQLPHNEVREFAAHPVTGDIWAGTGDGVVRISGRDFTVEAHHPVEVEGRRLRIKSLIFSEDGRTLWMAGGRSLLTYDVGAAGRRLSRNSVRSIAAEGRDSSAHAVFDMIRLRSGELLVGTRSGVVLWDPVDGRLIRNYPADRPGDHPRNIIFGLAQSFDGTIWLGSEQGGLARGSLANGRFTGWQWHDRDSGLPDDTIYAILPADSGRLWLSSNRGLIRYNPETNVSRHFTMGDGLQALEFNNTVAARGQSGLYYFGGIRGVNVFRPSDIELHPEPPRVYLQRAQIEAKALPLHGAGTLQVTTSHDRNSLLVEFVGLHFVEPSQNRYAYRLEGVDEDWVHSDSARPVRYPDLPPGRYRFEVKAANSDGVWSESRRLLQLEVAPPPWLTPWAYFAYAAVAVALLMGLLSAGRRRSRQLETIVATRTRELQGQKDLIDQQAQELEELLDTRTTLFANISHEFRTPLTLIDASLDRLLNDPEDSGALMAARRYLGRLLRLVDQLLDLSRLQATRRRPPPPVPWSLDQVVAMTVETFRPLAEDKGISLELSIDGRWMTQCQQADVERILLNLIGNAIKYCPAGSNVEVALTDDEGGVVVIVRDDGPGIEEEHQELIFERFSRMPAHENGRIEGAGIGLTLVHEAARFNGGQVELDSRPGEGCEFRVRLPAWRGHIEGAPLEQLAGQRLELELLNLTPEAQWNDSDRERTAGKPGQFGVALIAEDNADLRQHLCQALSEDWKTLEAEDGRQALQIAREQQPDVVVSDIMMPRLDGLELLRLLREDVRTSHLPVLLMTARQDEATRLQGYSLSADDFLAKPFKAGELKLRLRRMVDIRTRVRARLRRQLETSGQIPLDGGADQAGPDLADRDEQFLERIRDWLASHYEDSEAGVLELAEFLSMEPRTLQRKLKALTGLTPAAHLQIYRLERAKDMLAQRSLSVQQVAYACGFSSPQYFSRAFTQHFGDSPSKWRAQARDSS